MVDRVDSELLNIFRAWLVLMGLLKKLLMKDNGKAVSVMAKEQ